MRRVYYAFALRISLHWATLHAFAFGLLLYSLAALVHVDMVLNNIASTQVGDLGAKLIKVVFQADVLSVGVFGLLLFTVLSLSLRVPRIKQFEPA